MFSDFREPAASAAYEIAFDYLSRSGLVRDDFEAFTFLARCLTKMVDRGHTSKIAMANYAIAAYERTLSEQAAGELRLEAQHGVSIEQALNARLRRRRSV